MLMPEIFIGTNGMLYDDLYQISIKLADFGTVAFDTAPNYKMERVVGKIVKNCTSSGMLKRDNFFVQTKLDCIDQINNNVEKAFYTSLEETGLEYLDSYLMHWPYPDTFVKDWKVMEKLNKQGLVRYIGVCNFRERHWRKLLSSNPEIMPHINQIEIHPLRTCDALIDFSKKHDISIQAYSPLCKMIPSIAENNLLINLSKKYHVSIPEIVLAWHISRGVSPITKSSKLNRLIKNITSALSLSIETEDINSISSLNRDYKFFVESWGCPGF